MTQLALNLPNGELTLYLLENEGRAVCEHVKDGEPTRPEPPGTLTFDGRVWSWELCRICSAFHTLTPEQREEQPVRNLLNLIEHVDELPDER